MEFLTNKHIVEMSFREYQDIKDREKKLVDLCERIIKDNHSGIDAYNKLIKEPDGDLADFQSLWEFKEELKLIKEVK